MRWPMSSKHENCATARRSLVYRLGHGWQTTLFACVGGSNRCPAGARQRGFVTTQFEDTPYEVTLPLVQWLREQSYINVQSIQPVKFTEFIRKGRGKFDARVISEVEAALKRWLRL